MELKRPETEKEIDREKVLEEIERASNKGYVTEWDSEGRIAIQKDKSKIKRGKKSKASGGQFELRVRKDLEVKGWIVDKWSNNFDLEEGVVIPAKRKFNPFSKVMTIGTGFPDFICLERRGDLYKVIGVEVKMNGTSGQCVRVSSSRLSVPRALTPKSVSGSRAAQSWLG